MVLNMCLMEFVNNTFLDNFLTFCATVLHRKKYILTLLQVPTCLFKYNSLFYLYLYFITVI